MLPKASLNFTTQQVKDSLFNKTGAAIIGYTVGKTLEPLPPVIYKIVCGPKI